MRNKKLITLLVCLAMSVASVGALSSCGEKFECLVSEEDLKALKAED